MVYSRIQTRDLTPVTSTPYYGGSPDETDVERGCCKSAFHCDEEEWYNCCGKGAHELSFIQFYQFWQANIFARIITV